jgi:hypothetical protein
MQGSNQITHKKLWENMTTKVRVLSSQQCPTAVPCSRVPVVRLQKQTIKGEFFSVADRDPAPF